jgi:hypothetical protein
MLAQSLLQRFSALADMPHWRAPLQVDEEVNGSPASSTGLTVCFDSVEPHPSSRTRS